MARAGNTGSQSNTLLLNLAQRGEHQVCLPDRIRLDEVGFRRVLFHERPGPSVILLPFETSLTS